MTLLEVRGLRVAYGGVEALRGVDLVVEQGQVVALVGANGAGKTTLLRTLSGLLRPSAGEVLLDGARLDAVPPHDVVRRGLAHAPEGRRVFPLMTVAENLELGAYSRRRSEVAEGLEPVLELFPRLRERRDQRAGTLSGGEQQMLAIGRAMMSRPRLLLLDEPSTGLAPTVVATVVEGVRALRAAGTTVLLAEQDAQVALSLADVGYVLETGRVVAHGPAAALLGDPRVRAAYLGEG